MARQTNEMRWAAYLAVTLLAAGTGTFIQAQSAEEVTPPSHAQLQLIARPPTGEEKLLWAGVLFHLDAGWHIYWQNPGDSGTPPKIEWHLPAGYKAGAIQWPTPVRLGSGSVIDYGYENQVLLMTAIFRTAPVASADSSISADVKYVVCREVCIPGKAHLALVPANGGGDSATDGARLRALFEQTRTQLAKPAPETWRVVATDGKDHFSLIVRGAPGIKAASFFPLVPDQVENSAAQRFTADPSGFKLRLQKSEQLTKPITSLRGLVVLGPGHAVEVTAPFALPSCCDE